MKNAKMAAFYCSVVATALSGCLAGNNQTFFHHKYVCNALGEGGSGIKGKLYYLKADEAEKGVSSVTDFFGDRGLSPDVDFYMGRFNTPTRPFSEGFKINNTGEMVKDLEGNDLIENFAFKFKTKVKLPAGYAGRNMQFALLADDGARLVVDRKQPDGSIQRVVNVNNDGTHATRMACGTAPVFVDSTDGVDVEVDYYQGPRYHIALTLIWREWPVSGANDSQCGKTGSDYFWDSTTTPSTPQPAWNDILTRWQVVPSEVLVGDSDNPCAMLGL